MHKCAKNQSYFFTIDFECIILFPGVGLFSHNIVRKRCKNGLQLNCITHHIFIRILASTTPQYPHFSAHIFSMNFDQMVPAPTSQ